MAMDFSVHVFVRPGNIREMLKEEVDFDKKVWVIPAEKMKMKRDHIVPLTDDFKKVYATKIRKCYSGLILVNFVPSNETFAIRPLLLKTKA